MNTNILKKLVSFAATFRWGWFSTNDDVLYSCRANHLLLNSLGNLQYKDKHFHMNKSLKIGTNWTS